MTRLRETIRRAEKPTDSYPWAFGAVVALLVSVAGCGANKSGADPDTGAKPAPGRAALSVTVRAEPKRGWRDPRRESATYDMSTVGTGRAYETIDYGALDDIVVWVD